jgi:ParB family chromosome partitioning protein
VAKRGLGRGLGALIPEVTVSPQDRVQEVSVLALTPNPYQPRRSFDEERLAELADSIRRHGVLQPLIVRREVGGGYQVVAGERRLRAAKMAGLERVPVVVRELDDDRMLEIALVENLQRADLDPIEEAEALAQLLARGLSQEEVAAVVGRSRPAVANAVRLLQLPPSVQALIRSGQLSAGHGRALVGLPAPVAEALARRAVDEGLTVREMERLAARREAPPKATSPSGFRHWEERLLQRFQTRVRITGTPERGQITLAFRGEEELRRLLAVLLPDVED